MDATIEQKVRERAYGLWLASGMVHGLDNVHWLTAEAAIARAATAEPVVPTKPAAVKKPAKTAAGAVPSAGSPAVTAKRKVAAKVASKPRSAMKAEPAHPTA